MSNYYENVYLKRLNRYGMDYQSRIQGQRERVFEDLLRKSVYRVDFPYNNEIVPGLLERYTQTDTQTTQYLLTRVNLDIPVGTVLQIPNKNYEYGAPLTDDNTYYWMIFYLDNIKASGYNRYIVLQMTHFINWTDRDGIQRETRGYFYGNHRDKVIDTIMHDTNGALYQEPLMVSHLIMPLNEYMRKDDYFTVTDTGRSIVEPYRVTGLDRQSDLGVQFVTVDPVYERDLTPPPEKQPGDDDTDFYWLEGGLE